MHIGLFATAAGRGEAGPDTYEHFLTRGLAEIDKENDYRLFCLSQQAADSFQISQSNFTTEVLRPSSRWLSVPVTLPYRLRRSGVEMYHALFVPPPISFTPLVMTIHGVEIYKHPEFFRPRALRALKSLYKRGVHSAKRIICVSEHVRDVILERFDVPEDRLTVIYHGVNPTFKRYPADQAAELVATKFGIRDPYILFVGKLVAQKNIGRLLEAYDRFRKRNGNDVKLVLVGRTYAGLNSEFESTMARLNFGDSVIQLGHVNNYDLPPLYGAAQMFAFPTRYEGFGIPILEAMSCGVPVLTSTTSCVPEVAGDAAILIDPYDVEAIEDGMSRICSDPALRDDLKQRGIARAANFNWQKAARETLQAYKTVAQGANGD